MKKKMFLRAFAIARSDTYIKGAVAFATAVISKIVMGIPSAELAVTATFIRLAAAIFILVVAGKLNETRRKKAEVENWILGGFAAGTASALSSDVSFWLLKLSAFAFIVLAVKTIRIKSK